MAQDHELKTWPELFDPVWSGAKTAELRKNDRGFKVGDHLYLKEWSPEKHEQLQFAYGGEVLANSGRVFGDWDAAMKAAHEEAYTGRWVWALITHIVEGGDWLAPGYCMLSILILKRMEP